MSSGRIFINYRRDDSRADSGRLYDRLVSRFPGRVFRDVGSLEPGVKWHVAIADVLSKAEACIVVIGKEWSDIRNSAGTRRLDDPADMVRYEIVTALQKGTAIFPVLVGGAHMPDPKDLPADLQPLYDCNAIDITEQDWDGCYRRLLSALESVLNAPPEKIQRVPKSGSRLKWIAAGAIGLCILLAAVIGRSGSTDSPGSTKTESTAPNETPSATEAPVPLAESSRPSQEEFGSVPGQPTARQEINPAQLVGNWNVFVTSSAERHQDTLELYRDFSFRMLYQEQTALVGRWQYNSVSDSMELVNGTNLTNGNKFRCSFNSSGGQNAFSGSCQNRSQDTWNASLTRAGGGLQDPMDQIPNVDISDLSLAERASFIERLQFKRCTCTCKMTLLNCLEKDPTCPYSQGLASKELWLFRQMTRA